MTEEDRMNRQERIEKLAIWLNEYERGGGLEVPTWDGCDDALRYEYKGSAADLVAFLTTLGAVWVSEDQMLPIPSRNDRHFDYVDDSWQKACIEEQQNMIANGWRKVEGADGTETGG